MTPDAAAKPQPLERGIVGGIVYVVEDNADIAGVVCATLGEHGYHAQHFRTAAGFLNGLRRQAPAVSIVDLGLPDLDGFELMREARLISDSPILILTGRQSVDDRILGLELGADDYMMKPFEPREVVARVNTVLRRARRSQAPMESGPRKARFAGWTFEESCNRLTRGDAREAEQLSVAEARLLATLLRRPNRILSRAELLCAGGGREPLDRSIDARISRLRRKLEAGEGAPEVIKTVYGAGYMLVAKVEWA